jgi:hypothetical protein
VCRYSSSNCCFDVSSLSPTSLREYTPISDGRVWCMTTLKTKSTPWPLAPGSRRQQTKPRTRRLRDAIKNLRPCYQRPCLVLKSSHGPRLVFPNTTEAIARPQQHHNFYILDDHNHQSRPVFPLDAMPVELANGHAYDVLKLVLISGDVR